MRERVGDGNISYGITHNIYLYREREIDITKEREREREILEMASVVG